MIDLFHAPVSHYLEDHGLLQCYINVYSVNILLICFDFIADRDDSKVVMLMWPFITFSRHTDISGIIDYILLVLDIVFFAVFNE